jgi:SAM-dependent methyltransferase
MDVFTREGELVLEIGCGPKHYEKYCRGEYLGIDLAFDPDLKASATMLPLKSDSVDSIFAFDVLEHVSNLKMALEECNRVLKNGGKFIIITPNSLGFGIGDSYIDRTHKHHASWTSLEKSLNRSGFERCVRVPLHLHFFRPLRFIKHAKLTALQQSICLVANKPARLARADKE